MGFIDAMRSEGHAVESTCWVLREQGCQVAARTYRAWKRPTRLVAARTISDAQVVDLVRSLVWQTDPAGRRRMTPEGLYGRRKMTALVRRHLPGAAAGSVDRATRTLGLSGVRRAKGTRTTIPAKDGHRAGDLLNRDFTAPAPNQVWVTDFTYCHTWAGFVYVAFVVDVLAHTILGWHAQTGKDAGLVTTSARMAMWRRDREDQQPVPGQLVVHSDAGSQYTSFAFTQRLNDAGLDPSVGSVGDSLLTGYSTGWALPRHAVTRCVHRECGARVQHASHDR